MAVLTISFVKKLNYRFLMSFPKFTVLGQLRNKFLAAENFSPKVATIFVNDKTELTNQRPAQRFMQANLWLVENSIGKTSRPAVVWTKERGRTGCTKRLEIDPRVNLLSYTAISIKVVGSFQAYAKRPKGSVGSCKYVLVSRLSAVGQELQIS